jgi:hypothetical protein
MSSRPISGNSPTSVPAAAPDAESAQPVARASVSTQEVALEVAAAKGQATDGVEIEVLSVSARITADDVIVQGGMARIEVGTDDRAHTASLENFTFKATAGRTNSDGSKGFNAGASATVVGVEGTTTFLGASSVTGGLSVGVGAEAAVGTRDFDKDSNPELCARVSLLFFTAGLCVESPF